MSAVSFNGMEAQDGTGGALGPFQPLLPSGSSELAREDESLGESRALTSDFGPLSQQPSLA